MITLPEDRSMPLYQALYLQLRQQIQSGALPYGKKLPSKRKLSEQERAAEIAKLEKEMKEASKMLEFEYAAVLRDRIIELKGGK